MSGTTGDMRPEPGGVFNYRGSGKSSELQCAARHITIPAAASRVISGSDLPARAVCDADHAAPAVVDQVNPRAGSPADAVDRAGR